MSRFFEPTKVVGVTLYREVKEPQARVALYCCTVTPFLPLLPPEKFRASVNGAAASGVFRTCIPVTPRDTSVLGEDVGVTVTGKVGETYSDNKHRYKSNIPCERGMGGR